ncbi:dual specificity protein phosphatase 3-like isoform X1 [Glandiceps talaboti]
MATSCDSSVSCTMEELNTILREPSPKGILMLPSNSEDEVWPRLYISAVATAKDVDRLKHLGITHVLNVAQGTRFGHVDTDETYYENSGIIFKGIKATDVAGFKLLPFWEDTGEFIHTALSEQGTKILVHCREGFSRSAATTIAYLMMYHNLTAQEATRAVRAKREVGPNAGFLKQLCQLDATLLEKRESSK